MGWFSRFMLRRDEPLSVRFDGIDSTSVPPSFFGLASYEDVTAKVPRRMAIQVPAVKRGRDLVAGQLGTLPIDLIGPGVFTSELLDQPEVGIPRSVTMARTYEDICYEGVAFWMVTTYGWHGYPVKAVRLDPGTDLRQQVEVYRSKMGKTGTAVRWETDPDIIRFDSPNDAWLSAGARAIRTCIALDKAAAVYSGGGQPLDYFTPADGVDPDQEALDAALEAWEEARRQHATGYVPGQLKYNTAGWNPEQLQMAEARQHAVLEIARVVGVDPEDLGVSTTSRTYQNAQDRWQQRIKDTLRSYAVAVEERLSMPDVTPRGYVAKVNFSDLERTDDKTRVEVASAAKTAGLFDDSEAKDYFNPAVGRAAQRSTANAQ